jgi:hypothetical protein
MNALTPSHLDGEILPPGGMIRVVGKTHPLSGGRIECLVQAGSSITEILLEALSERPDLRLRRDFVVHVDGDFIPEAMWSHVRVKLGATVTFTPLLQDSGTLRSVLGVVVAVAALIIAPYAAGVILGLTGTALSVGTALVAGGIILAGTLALNALFPTRPAASPESISSTALNSIQGAQNQLGSIEQAVPVVLGRHRQSPFYGAKPYTEIVGDDQYLRLLFVVGYGPLEISDIKIGETPLSSFEGVTTEIRQGFPGDAPITLYPGQVDEVALSIELDNAVDPAGVEGSGGYWQTQNTSPDTDEISLDWTATQGCFHINQKTGAPEDWRVPIHTQYRAVGSPTWIDLPSINFTRSVDPCRRGLNWTVARGYYEVRTQKGTGDGDPAQVKDTIVWTAIRSIKHAPPITFPKPLALIALRIKATNQLTGVISTLNCVCRSLVQAYSGTPGVWLDNTGSQWPSDLFRLALQGPANARPRADAQIDVANLEEWWAFCVANAFKFNQVRATAGQTVSQALDDIAAAGRAVKTFANGTWGVSWDRPNDPIVQHFTPRNSWDFRLQKPYAQQPHGWRVSFINERNGFTRDEITVYDDGYDSSNATLFEGIEFPGVTDPDLIWKHGRFHIAQSRLRPEKISLSCGWENIICTHGDRVYVAHDVLLIGLAWGRVKSVDGQIVTFDEQVTIEDGKTYGFKFRVAEDIRSITRVVDPGDIDDPLPAGDYYSLTLVGDLSLIAPGTLFSFGETDREAAVYRVQGKAHQKDLIATLTLVDDAPAIALADQGAIPPYNPNITIPPDPFTLPPRDLRYLEVIDGNGATVRALVRLLWQVPRVGKIATFEVQQRDDDTGGPWVTVDSVPIPRTTADVSLVAAGVWSFRVRCIFSDGTFSDWASLIGLSLQGLTFPPGDITNLHQHSVDGQTVLDWTPVNDQRILYYEVRKGSSWDTGLVVGDAVSQPPWPTTGDGSYHVRAYVLSPFGLRIYSVATASITIAGSIIERNIIVSRDELATLWTGALDGGARDGSFIRTDAGASITLPFAQEVVDELALTGLHIAVYVSQIIVDIGRAAECRYWTKFDGSGVLQGADFLGQSDVLGSGDALGVSPTRFIRILPIWRFATGGNNDVFAPADVYGLPDAFSGDIEWGDWVSSASGTRVSRFFTPGIVVITDAADTDATATEFSWFVDVPDRNDDYTQLAVPDTGLDVVFYAGGYAATPAGGAAPTPYNGGPNGSTVPHVQRGIVNNTNGDEVKITNLTLAGCTVHVVNAGSNVTRSGVNLLVRGY